MKRFAYSFCRLGNQTERQIKSRFTPFSWVVKEYGGVKLDDYFQADRGVIEAANELAACEKLFFIYNWCCPAITGYTGPSMSVSDIVRLWDNETEPATKTIWFCDSVGFVRLDEDGKAIAE